MKKLLLLMVAGVMAVMTLSAATWSSAPTTAAGWDAVLSPSSSTTTTAPTTWKDSSASPDVAWSLDYTWQTEGKVYYSRGKNGLQLGSGSAGLKGMTISSEDFSGTISKVTLKGAKSNGSAKISVKVGEVEFTINDAQSKTLSSTATDCEFIGNGSGKIEIMLSGNADGKYIIFTGLEVVYEESVVTPTLGNITVSYGANATPVVQDDILEGIVEGTVFTFSAENAESIVVTNSENTTIAQGIATANWTATLTEAEELTVTATLGDEEKKFTFALEVVEAPKPVLGDIVVTYGDGIVVEEGDNGLSVETGITFTIYAENATHITATRWSDFEDVIDVDSDKATYAFNEPISDEGLTITATNGIDTKEFEFLLSVTEPIVPETTTWSLVTKDMVIVPGQEYVIAGTGVDRNNSDIEVDYILNTFASANNRISSSIIEIDKTNNSISLTSEDKYQKIVFEKADETGFYVKSEGKYLSAYKTSAGKIQNQLRLIEQLDETLCYITVDIDDNGDALLKFVKMADAEDSCPWIHLFSQKGSDTYWNCYTNHSGKKSYQLYTQEVAVAQPEIPAFDLMEDDATKVAMMSTKGELHVWTVEYDKDGNVVKENGEDVAASVMAKAPAADDKAWTNKVADEGVKYEIEVPTTQGNYLTIRAKSVLNELHSEELVKNVDASGNVISGVEEIMADDANAPVEYFNLQGVRVAADQPGLYIRRQGSKVEKVSIAH